MALTHILEFSRSPLSVSTPVWTDISAYLLEVPDCSLGVDGDLAEPQPGTATFRLDNRDRRFEPEFAVGAYYPDIRPLRRIRWRSNDGTDTHDNFHGYVVDWGPSWPGGMNQEAVVQCVDGVALLALDALDLLDPPSATAYPDVVMHDEPFGYWRQGGLATSTRMEAAAGDAGTYRNSPLRDEPGLILGDTDGAVRYDKASSHHATVVVDVDNFSDKRVTVECWVKFTTTVTTNERLIAGPLNTGVSFPIFDLHVQDAGAGAKARFFVETTVGSPGAIGATTILAGTIYHIVGTWDGATARIDVNGVLDGSSATLAQTMRAPTAGQPLNIARFTPGSPFHPNATIDEVAVYERALSVERVAAHYAAGTSGFAQQTAGARIAAVATSALWATTDIQTGAHDVQPVMEHGQAKIEEIRAAVKAETPASLFYFKGNGEPRYLGWEYRATAPYNEPAATFGNLPGEVPFEDIQIAYDDEMFNEVTVTHQTTDEGEASHTVSDAASDGEFYRRALPPYDTTLVHHADAEAVAGAILSDHSQPQRRIDSLTLSNLDTAAQTQILTRLPGDLIRVKHRPKGGTAIDQVTHIRGRKLRLNPADGDRARVLECDWQLARGFNAAAGVWRAGIVGFTEAGTTTVAA